MLLLLSLLQLLLLLLLLLVLVLLLQLVLLMLLSRLQLFVSLCEGRDLRFFLPTAVAPRCVDMRTCVNACLNLFVARLMSSSAPPLA